MKYQSISVIVKPNSTIEALIRHYNHYNVNRSQIDFLLTEFNKLNLHAHPPKPGQVVEIPVLIDNISIKPNV